MGLQVGDAVKILRTKHTVSGGSFIATYVGKAASYSVGDYTFQAGESIPLTNTKLIGYLCHNPDFQLLPARGRKVEIGRVLEIFVHTRDSWSWSPEAIADKLSDVTVISPDGVVVSCLKVEPLDAAGLDQLQVAEMGHVAEGRKPYSGKLVPAGRGRWRVPDQKPQPAPGPTRRTELAEDACPECKGVGHLPEMSVLGRETGRVVECTRCGGTGKITDPTEYGKKWEEVL